MWVNPSPVGIELSDTRARGPLWSPMSGSMRITRPSDRAIDGADSSARTTGCEATVVQPHEVWAASGTSPVAILVERAQSLDAVLLDYLSRRSKLPA